MGKYLKGGEEAAPAAVKAVPTADAAAGDKAAGRGGVEAAPEAGEAAEAPTADAPAAGEEGADAQVGKEAPADASPADEAAAGDAFTPCRHEREVHNTHSPRPPCQPPRRQRYPCW